MFSPSGVRAICEITKIPFEKLGRCRQTRAGPRNPQSRTWSRSGNPTPQLESIHMRLSTAFQRSHSHRDSWPGCGDIHHSILHIAAFESVFCVLRANEALDHKMMLTNVEALVELYNFGFKSKKFPRWSNKFQYTSAIPVNKFQYKSTIQSITFNTNLLEAILKATKVSWITSLNTSLWKSPVGLNNSVQRKA
ncbi:hypothetical protein C8R45DRAFT_945249 [Mycena sanguinolenta]|nr:hypothetical protein C8R45DRAFT_945248 [Mycena sanguinolenta]KAJ6453412.1 hypothetical protein C8R45DRAFT_945249 [Mycena sanguinolenta]